jgi:hypothetical protein
MPSTEFPHAAKRQVYCERHPRLIDLRNWATRMAEALEGRYLSTSDPERRRCISTSVAALRNMVVCLDFVFDFAATATDDTPLAPKEIDRELAALNEMLVDIGLDENAIRL